MVVEEFIEDNGLVCINSGKGTRYNNANNTESVIDLTLVSDDITGISGWEVKNLSPLGSDHYPIVTAVGIKVQRNKELGITRRK